MTKIDLRDYDAVLLDLDGTIWAEDVPLPGAVDLIRRLQSRGQPFAFISNSDLATSRLLARFRAMGVEVDLTTLYTAARAACDHVRRHWPAGVQVFSLAGDAVPELLGDHARLVGEAEPRADVVITASLAQPDCTIHRLQLAMRHLLSGATLVSMCADRRYPTPEGPEIGSGGVAAMLAHGANVVPLFCGKPQRVFFESLCHHLKVRPARCVLVGDNLESDVAGARQFGMRTILPLTGITTRAHLEHLDASLAPDEVVEDLRSLA